MEPDPRALPTVEVRHPVMVMDWAKLTFIHWRYTAEDVQRLLPDGLRVHEFDGSAWVSLVPFHLTVRLPGIPAVPWLSKFPETNVRTYVIDEQGRPGIWFFSLDAERSSAVATARLTYRLPYFWSRMSISEEPDRISYSSVRRIPGPRGAFCHADVSIGDVFEPTELDHFVTARWKLFSLHHHGLSYADAVHEAWPLQRATVERLDQTLVQASGLPAPVGEPVVHYSKLVSVNIGMPHRM